MENTNQHHAQQKHLLPVNLQFQQGAHRLTHIFFRNILRNMLKMAIGIYGPVFVKLLH